MERGMNVHTQISDYLAAQPGRQASAARPHSGIDAGLPVVVPGWHGRAWSHGLEPRRRVWTPDNDVRRWANREFHRLGISANTPGISVPIMGLEDTTYLAETCGGVRGKASGTGCCIEFRTRRNVNLDIREAAMRDGVA
jgi:hypothetical protein